MALMSVENGTPKVLNRSLQGAKRYTRQRCKSVKISSDNGQHLSKMELSDAETEFVSTVEVLLCKGKETGRTLIQKILTSESCR